MKEQSTCQCPGRDGIQKAWTADGIAERAVPAHPELQNAVASLVSQQQQPASHTRGVCASLAVSLWHGIRIFRPPIPTCKPHRAAHHGSSAAPSPACALSPNPLHCEQTRPWGTQSLATAAAGLPLDSALMGAFRLSRGRPSPAAETESTVHTYPYNAVNTHIHACSVPDGRLYRNVCRHQKAPVKLMSPPGARPHPDSG